ncbi:MAG: GH32 C-terminal domain-containing protein, partial [Muribaculaceae bacterium]|nr:GH32 C-terminal domain-containing protein [Muribaculaceae bacterium]
FIDRSSIELFGNDGRFVMTNLVFPNEPYATLSVAAKDGTARISNLKIYSLKLN